ncbi:MAG: nucleoside-triphosphatase [Candidatus Marinimicrobia bacterium]|nr:nucleoside-triphosphatase [Candidatus Neomarinimicrobiota bacterium]
MINIVTGEIDSGKTHYLKDLYEKDHKGDGILSLKHYKDDRFLGYDLFHLKSREKEAFIRFKSQLPESWNEKLEIGKYSFSCEGFAFAEKVLKNIDEGPVYIDEVGPLEMLDKKGFYERLKELINQNIDLFITVRSTLIDALHDEFGLNGKTNIITLK